MPPKVRLTPAQLAVLRHAAEKPGSVWRSTSIRDLYHSYDSAGPRRVNVNKQVERLSEEDLLRIVPRATSDHWHVTDLGRAVLAEYTSQGRPILEGP
jgi:hypothetical protein